jgi:hypothetical protein
MEEKIIQTVLLRDAFCRSPNAGESKVPLDKGGFRGIASDFVGRRKAIPPGPPLSRGEI